MTTSTGPAQVLIIRHGEKLGDPANDDDGGPDLSIRGSARAAALVSLFAPEQPTLSCALTVGTKAYTATFPSVQSQGAPPRFNPPDFVFATQASKSSNRPVETITPVLAAFAMTCDDKHADDDYDKVAEDILTNSKYAQKTVLVCWHHGRIPDLTNRLGVADPPPWNPAVFDRVWQVTYEAGTASLVDLPQSLLYGDSSS
jgi:hypothetical protein